VLPAIVDVPRTRATPDWTSIPSCPAETPIAAAGRGRRVGDHGDPVGPTAWITACTTAVHVHAVGDDLDGHPRVGQQCQRRPGTRVQRGIALKNGCPPVRALGHAPGLSYLRSVCPLRQPLPAEKPGSASLPCSWGQADHPDVFAGAPIRFISADPAGTHMCRVLHTGPAPARPRWMPRYAFVRP